MWRARAFGALAASLVIAGCSLLTNLDGLANGAVAQGEGGGGTQGADATLESSVADGSKDDALVDSATPNTADCPGTHFFCTDFDKLALTSEWDVITPGNGTLDRNAAASVSSPFSLLVTRPAGELQVTPVVTKTLPTAGSNGLRCRFKYRRDTIDDTAVLVVLMVNFDTPTAERLFVEIKDGQANGRIYLESTLADGGTLSDFPTIPTFATALGSWASVEWTIDLRALRSSLTSDAKLVDQRPIPAFDGSRVKSIKLSLGLGTFIASVSPWQVRYDDFVCDALP